MVGIRPLLLALLMLAVIPASAAADTETRIVVERDPGLSAAERRDIRADADVRYVESLSLPRTEVVAAESGDVADAVRDLNADPDVVYAQPARARRPAADPFLGALWAFNNTRQNVSGFGQGTLDADMDVIEAWTASTGAGQTVAVVDTGVDRTHPDLAGQVFGGYDFLDDDPDPSDPSGHGTHVSGTIAAARDNNEGVAGVAPDSIVVPLRALGAGATDIETGDAFAWAGDHGVRIVNASLSGVQSSSYERNAMAAHPETLYIVAAGNDDDNVDSGNSAYPCAYNLANVLCVGASDPNDARADFDGIEPSGSNFGATSVDVFAPGVGIVSTEAGEYFVSSGTSMATPHVAGVAALIAARNPALSAAAIKASILNRGDAKAGLTGQSVTGRRVNANSSLAAVAASPNAAAPLLSDLDGDVVTDASDNCLLEPNPDQADGDGDDAGDACDDRDGDGEVDAPDNCVIVDNADQADGDGDGTGDACLTDRDGDTHDDGADNCPTVTNDQTDGDTDGEGDACDDGDGDGPFDAFDNCAAVANTDQADQDGDDVGDLCDDDRDGDGDLEADDNCPTMVNPDQADRNGDGAGDVCDDEDGDQWFDVADNCADDANLDQADQDGDTLGDVCDDDRDGDGKLNDDDNCLAVVNPDQLDTDGDGQGNACDGDDDNDGDLDGADNCSTVANPTQANTDGDAHGDACDADLDGDGAGNGSDNCPTAWNANQADADRDRLGDACDGSPRGPDSDGDGRPNMDDSCPTVFGTLANGCAPQVATPPLAQVSSLSAKAKKRGKRRSATIRVRTTHAATVRITIERKKGRRWVRVKRKTIVVSGTRATYRVSRLKRGRHRVRISISSSAGRGDSASKTFRVR
jgi:subtilisin family serine protease